MIFITKLISCVCLPMMVVRDFLINKILYSKRIDITTFNLSRKYLKKLIKCHEDIFSSIIMWHLYGMMMWHLSSDDMVFM